MNAAWIANTMREIKKQQTLMATEKELSFPMAMMMKKLPGKGDGELGKAPVTI